MQDDFAVAETYGIPIRLDDHGDTTGSATPLVAVIDNGVTTLQGQGVIERANDVDMFSFASNAGTIAVSASPAARSPNLDMLIELRNSAGTVLASANPVDNLPASLSWVSNAPGTFYVSVRGTGKGDPLGTGYTSYGSVGNYAVTVSTPTWINQAASGSGHGNTHQRYRTADGDLLERRFDRSGRHHCRLRVDLRRRFAGGQRCQCRMSATPARSTHS